MWQEASRIKFRGEMSKFSNKSAKNQSTLASLKITIINQSTLASSKATIIFSLGFPSVSQLAVAVGGTLEFWMGQLFL